MEKRIETIKPYFKEMQIINVEGEDAVYIKVCFPQKWIIPDDINKYKIETLKDKSTSDTIFFTELSNGYNKIFDAIEYTIKKNKDAEERINIFHQKIKELESIFKDETNKLDKLRNLSFTFDKSKRSKNKLLTTINGTINNGINEKIESNEQNNIEEVNTCQQD